MKDNSLNQLGGIGSVLVGVSYLVTGVTAILLPANMNGLPDVQSPFMYFEANRGLLMTQYWAFAIGAVFALAMLPAVSATVRHLNEGWVRWTTTLATLAFAVTFLDNYWAIVTTPARAAAYVAGSEAFRAALTVPGAPQFIDVQSWLGNGAVGLWGLVISLLALRGKVWPKGLAYLGLLGALAYFFGLAAQLIPDLLLSGLGIAIAGVGAVLGPIWFTWMGLVLLRLRAPNMVPQV